MLTATLHLMLRTYHLLFNQFPPVGRLGCSWFSTVEIIPEKLQRTTCSFISRGSLCLQLLSGWVRAEKHHPLGAPRLPLWTDGPAASLAKWEEENLSEQGSPSGDPTSCQISWGNSLTPRSPFPHWSDRNHADDSLAECPVRGKCSVSVDSHHVVIFILLLHLSSQTANHTGQGGHSWDPNSHPFFPLSI